MQWAQLSGLVHALAGGLGGQSAPLLHCTVDLEQQSILGTVSGLVHALAGGPGGQSAPLLHCTVDLAQQCILGTVSGLVHALAGGPGGKSAPPAALHSEPGSGPGTTVHLRHSVWLSACTGGGPRGQSAPLLHCTVDLAQQCLSNA